jgi:O-antigen/teichoic acid export membrane protein
MWPPQGGEPRPESESVSSRGPDGKPSDLVLLARGGVINLIGNLVSGILGFVVIILVTRGLHARRAGLFFEALALFSILSNTVELGADDGLVRMVSRHRMLHRLQDIRRTIEVGLVPVLLGGTLAAAAILIFAPQLAHVLIKGGDLSGSLVPYIRLLAAFLPLSAATTVLLAASRGFGSMVPTALIDSIGLPVLRAIMVVVVLAAGFGGAAVTIAWASPLVLAAAAAVIVLLRQVRRSEPDERGSSGGVRATWTLAGEFWRFAAPRGVSAVIGVSIYWLDTLLVGALLGPQQAAIYTAATRFIILGFVVLGAVQFITAPLVSALLADGGALRAQAVYQTATQWLMLPTWPIYLLLGIFAPLFLSVFGPGFEAGHGALTLIALAMLVSTAAGPCSVVLLMGGKSGWTLMVAAISLAMNIVLNLTLIPHLGINGAAIAWTCSIVFNNLCGIALVRVLLRLSPFSEGALLLGGSALVLFGGLGLAGRLVLGPTLAGLLASGVPATALYAALLSSRRTLLHLSELRQAVQVRGRTLRELGEESP